MEGISVILKRSLHAGYLARGPRSVYLQKLNAVWFLLSIDCSVTHYVRVISVFLLNSVLGDLRLWKLDGLDIPIYYLFRYRWGGHTQFFPPRHQLRTKSTFRRVSLCCRSPPRSWKPLVNVNNHFSGVLAIILRLRAILVVDNFNPAGTSLNSPGASPSFPVFLNCSTTSPSLRYTTVSSK